MNHIVVCGYSRSGTTLFYNMLRNSLAGYRFFDRELPAARVIGAGPGNSASKSPLDVFNLEKIQQHNRFQKKLLLLILIRDIRSILTSYHAAVPDDYFIAYDRQYSPDYSGSARYINPGVIPTAHAIEAARRRKDCQSIIVRYETLVMNPRAQQERIARLANLRFSEDFEQFHRHSAPAMLSRQLNGHRPLDATRLDAWRNKEHEQRIRSQFTCCPALFDLLIRYGYETNRDWFDAYRRPRAPV